jgi:hypothetical protein
MVKKGLVALILIFLVNTVYGQESNKKAGTDSLRRNTAVNRYFLFGLHPELRITPKLSETTLHSNWFLRQSITNLPVSLSTSFQQQIDVISPWKEEVVREKELRTLTFLLQTVEAGGTAYILYEHIKKYGLK